MGLWRVTGGLRSHIWLLAVALDSADRVVHHRGNFHWATLLHSSGRCAPTHLSFPPKWLSPKGNCPIKRHLFASVSQPDHHPEKRSAQGSLWPARSYVWCGGDRCARAAETGAQAGLSSREQRYVPRQQTHLNSNVREKKT